MQLPWRTIVLVLPFLAGCSLSPGLPASSFGLGATAPGRTLARAPGNPHVGAGLLGDPFAIALPAYPRVRNSSPDIAFNPAARQYLVVWSAAHLPKGPGTVYGKLLDQAGNPLGDPFELTTELVNGGDPSVAYNPATRKYLVVWTQGRNPAPVRAIMRLLGADGTPLGDAVPLSPVPDDTFPRRHQGSPCVVANPATHEFLVAWSDDPDGQSNLYARRVAQDGTFLGAPFALAPSPRYQDTPSVAYNPDTGEYLAAWEEEQDVLGLRLAADGSRLGEVLPIAAREGSQTTPKVVCNDQLGRYFVVWADAATLSGEANILGRQFGKQGNAIGDDVPIAVSPGQHLAPNLAFNSADNQYLVAWMDDPHTGIFLTQAQRIGGANARPLGESFAVGVQGDDYTPAIAFNARRDEFLVIWEQVGSIFGRRVDGAGR